MSQASIPSQMNHLITKQTKTLWYVVFWLAWSENGNHSFDVNIIIRLFSYIIENCLLTWLKIEWQKSLCPSPWEGLGCAVLYTGNRETNMHTERKRLLRTNMATFFKRLVSRGHYTHAVSVYLLLVFVLFYITFVFASLGVACLFCLFISLQIICALYIF